jgi:hypothetical protein
LQILLVGLLWRQNHPQARLHLVFAKFLLQALQIEGILDEFVVDLNKELVPLELAEPLDPALLLVLQGRIVTEPINLILILIRLAVIVLLLLLLHR